MNKQLKLNDGNDNSILLVCLRRSLLDALNLQDTESHHAGYEDMTKLTLLTIIVHNGCME